MRLLVLLPFIPDPTDRGLNQRGFHLIQGLSKYFEIDLFCLTQKSISLSNQRIFTGFCKRIYFNQSDTQVVEDLEHFAIQSQTPYDRIFVGGLQLWPYIEAVFPSHPGIILDHNFVNKEPPESESSIALEVLHSLKQLNKTKKAEQASHPKAAIEIFPSELACASLEKTSAQGSNRFVLPDGIDSAYYNIQLLPHCPTENPSAIFCADLDKDFSVDAIQWYLESIHPEIAKRFVDFKLKIIGDNPTPAIIKLVSNMEGVELISGITDLRPYYQQAWFQIAPLRLAHKNHLPLMEGLAMGLPAICTTLAAECLQPDSRVMIADNTKSFIQAMACCIDEPSALKQTIDQPIQEKHSWLARAQVLAQAIRTLQAPIPRIIPSPDVSREPQLIVLLGLPFHNLTMDEAVEECVSVIEARTPSYFVTPNVDFATL
ncbi:MAG: hypothetical protein B7X06_03045, partial [Verrucomicrobia bacterium 21-51-4]